MRIVKRAREGKKQTDIDDVVKEHLEEAKKTEANKFKRGGKSERGEKAILGASSQSERSDISAEESAKENIQPEPAPYKVKKVKNARIL